MKFHIEINSIYFRRDHIKIYLKYLLFVYAKRLETIIWNSSVPIPIRGSSQVEHYHSRTIFSSTCFLTMYWIRMNVLLNVCDDDISCGAISS
jgi:hypothetical protein